MTIDDLKQLLEMISAHELVEFELEQDGVKLRVRRDSAHPPAPAAVMAPALVGAPALVSPPAAAPVAVAAPTSSNGDAADAADAAVELSVVTSPIVGTFYRSSAPGAAPFVEVGSMVTKGQVLCIIEAMKLMNEIESEYEGRIVKVYVENGQPVQYGERLFAIQAR